MDETDILIAGGGIAGLAAAAALAAEGWRVVVADPAPPGEGALDTRSTAFLAPARRLFEAAGVWDALAPHATRLDALRLVDTSGWPPVERARREFAAADLGLETFGWNLPNAATRSALAAALSGRPGVDLRAGTGFRSALVRDREAVVSLTDGSRLAARLVVGADGRASAVREAAGIGASVTRYGQRALAFSVTHPEPHANVSTEIYNRAAPSPSCRCPTARPPPPRRWSGCRAARARRTSPPPPPTRSAPTPRPAPAPSSGRSRSPRRQAPGRSSPSSPAA